MLMAKAKFNLRPGQHDQHDQHERSVRAAIASIPRIGPHVHLRALKIERDGVVLLDGEVPDVAAKKLALEKVAALPFVTGIADHLHVAPAVPMSDKEIRAHLADALIEERSFDGIELRRRQDGQVELLRGAPIDQRGSIEFEVKDGVVTLNGRVPTLTSKRLAGVIAWWVPGVRDVINGIEVDPPEEDSPDMIAEAVRVVLEKDPFVNASQIRVGVRKTLVRLTGLVHDQAQRDAAERDAWMVFGVDNVVNEIEVRP
jgi:osmotically-inducible protein OsmY